MKKFVYFATIAIICAACSDNGQKQAEDLLNQAQTAFEAGEYNNAKVLLDSIDATYPKCFEIRKAGRTLGYKVNLKIEENTKEATEILIEEYNDKIKEITQKYFVFEKSEYDEIGRFIFNGSEIENNVQRSYIHAAVDEYGVSHLISTYSGNKDINHTALKIVASDGSSVTTEHIPYNDGSNYKYVIDGTHYESVTYIGEKDNGALAFIASHSGDKGLKAFFISEQKEIPVTISTKEREALSASYELSVVLSEQSEFIKQNKVAQGKILYLQDKLLGE